MFNYAFAVLRNIKRGDNYESQMMCTEMTLAGETEENHE
jgi:hypothetical protein